MFDWEIQKMPTAELRKVFDRVKNSTRAGEIDLAVRIAKELRYRNRHQHSKD